MSDEECGQSGSTSRRVGVVSQLFVHHETMSRLPSTRRGHVRVSIHRRALSAAHHLARLPRFFRVVDAADIRFLMAHVSGHPAIHRDTHLNAVTKITRLHGDNYTGTNLKQPSVGLGCPALPAAGSFIQIPTNTSEYKPLQTTRQELWTR